MPIKCDVKCDNIVQDNLTNLTSKSKPHHVLNNNKNYIYLYD
jgi:hypothetical protein